MDVFKQEYWSGLLLPAPGNLCNPGIKPASLASPALAGGFSITVPPGKTPSCLSWWQPHSSDCPEAIESLLVPLFSLRLHNPSFRSFWWCHLRNRPESADFSPAPLVICLLVTQLCPTLCNPIDCSPRGSSVHGIFQARILVWVANPFSRRSFQSRDWTQVSCIAGRFFTIWATGTCHSPPRPPPPAANVQVQLTVISHKDTAVAFQPTSLLLFFLHPQSIWTQQPKWFFLKISSSCLSSHLKTTQWLSILLRVKAKVLTMAQYKLVPPHLWSHLVILYVLQTVSETHRPTTSALGPLH